MNNGLKEPLENVWEELRGRSEASQAGSQQHPHLFLRDTGLVERLLVGEGKRGVVRRGTKEGKRRRGKEEGEEGREEKEGRKEGRRGGRK